MVAPLAATHMARHGTGAPKTAPASDEAIVAVATTAKAVDDPAPVPTLTSAAPVVTTAATLSHTPVCTGVTPARQSGATSAARRSPRCTNRACSPKSPTEPDALVNDPANHASAAT